MKYNLVFLIIGLFSITSFAQPQGINYQGVARDSIGHPIINQNISLRLSILGGSATGSAVYVETQNTVTNGSGLFNISIGMGSVVSGVFADVPWGAGEKWLKVEMDLGGGSNYLIMGTTQFLSVPYALHAGKISGNNSDNWEYYGKVSWQNSKDTNTFSNLPLHDFWKLDLNIRNNNNYFLLVMTINNVYNNSNYKTYFINGQPPDYNDRIRFVYQGSCNLNGVLIIQGKHFNGIKSISTENYSGCQDAQLFPRLFMINDMNNLNSIQFYPFNDPMAGNLSGQIELYFRDNK